MRQGNVKNTFYNGLLPQDGVIVVKCPVGCPKSSPNNTLWKLKKTLYGLVHTPLHWYNNISTFFQSIGLKNSQNSPCIFVSQILPHETPLYLGLYVNDFYYYSTSNKVEEKFEWLLDEKYTVSYKNQLEWFLGMKFEW